MNQQDTQPVLRRPRPPQAPEEPLCCAASVSVWLKEQDHFDGPALQGYTSQHGVSISKAGPQESVLVFYGEEELTTLISVNFAEVKFFRVCPLAVTDETPT